MPSVYTSILLQCLQKSEMAFSFKELVETRNDERARAELVARHREGTNSFHFPQKMMEQAFTGSLLLFAAAAVATIQQQVCPVLFCYLGNQTS